MAAEFCIKDLSEIAWVDLLLRSLTRKEDE
jgi:hypothetical protein